MKNDDIIAVFENHLKFLENAAQQQYSGVEIKAITEAMRLTVNMIEYLGHCNFSNEGECITNPLSEN